MQKNNVRIVLIIWGYVFILSGLSLVCLFSNKPLPVFVSDKNRTHARNRPVSGVFFFEANLSHHPYLQCITESYSQLGFNTLLIMLSLTKLQIKHAINSL